LLSVKATLVNTQMSTRMVHAMTFGGLMRTLMAERDISLRQLAKSIPADVGHLSKISRDRKPPSEQMAERIDTALGAGGTLAALRPVSDVRRILNGRFTPDDEERLVAAARTPRRHDPGVVDALATVLDGQRRTEDVIGSTPLIQPVAGQLAVVQNLVTEARGDLRPDVVRIGSQWAQFAAWLHANTGQLDDAQLLYGRALDWATEVDDAHMIGTALNMQGHTAWLGGKIGPMIGLSQAAQRDTGASPGVLALAAQQEARGRALTGDAETTCRKLDEAAELLATAAEHTDDEPPWIYFYGPGFLTVQRGLAYRFLGRSVEAEGDQEAARWYARAIEMFEAGLAAMPANIRNAEFVGSYLYQLAATDAAAGDVAQASERAREAAVIARQTSSSRLDGDLGRLAARLHARWPNHPAVAEVLDALR
jgi:transcriptional regulator with XRE-family HTH domain